MSDHDESTYKLEMRLLVEQFGISPPRNSYFRWKQRWDPVIALMLLVPAFPLIVLLRVLVRLTSPGAPALFRQVRAGRMGATFTMYKIRTMRPNAESRTGAVWSSQNDPRHTWLGRWLRKLHLDELPQLLNVLRGEMSLIGPRPERPEFVRVLVEQIPGYLDRLAVSPGITGLAQINLPPDSNLDSVRRKQRLDLEYVRTASLFLDLRMLLCTALRLVGLNGLAVMRWMRLERVANHGHMTLERTPTPEEIEHSAEAAVRRLDVRTEAAPRREVAWATEAESVE